MTTKRIEEEIVIVHGKRFRVWAVFVEYAAWHKTPTGWYGWAREAGTKRRGCVTAALGTAEEARLAAKRHVEADGRKSLAQVLYEAEDLYSDPWETMSSDCRAQYERMASAAKAALKEAT